MSSEQTAESSPGAPDPTAPDDRHSGFARMGLAVLGGVVLLASVAFLASPNWAAPFLPGREHSVIVGDPRIAGGPEELPEVSTLAAFTDLSRPTYEPLATWSYATLWRLAPAADQPKLNRALDAALHALAACALWWLAWLLLSGGAGTSAGAGLLAWALAALWAWHPLIAPAWAAGAPRGVLLGALFSIIAVGAQLCALRGRPLWYALAMPALVLALLSGPMLVAPVVMVWLEFSHRGVRAFSRPAVYACAFFGVGAAWIATQTTPPLALEGVRAAEFGDPLARGLHAAAVYLRDTVTPTWLGAGELNAIDVSWAAPLVWGGAVLALATLAVWLLAPQSAGALGLLWFWASWVSLTALAAGRTGAAPPAYAYPAVIGLIIGLGALVVRLAQLRPTARRAGDIRGVAFVVLVFAVVMGLRGYQRVAGARDPVIAATELVALAPEDPRAARRMADAISWQAQHVPPESEEFNTLLEQFLAELRRAHDLAQRNPEYFREDHATFFAQISHDWLGVGDAPQALEAAQQAAKIDEASIPAQLSLAHALVSVGRPAEALDAYAALEKLIDAQRERLPAEFVANMLTEYADLLLEGGETMGDARLILAARDRFMKALDTGAAGAGATIGAARCEILAGQGADGAKLLRGLLQLDPDNTAALLNLALYHLRSAQLEEAAGVYATILERDPTNYEALRGFHELCAQLDRWDAAAQSWRIALAAVPQAREFASFFVWSLACGGAPDADAAISELLKSDENNPFGCLGRMIIRLRENKPAEALDWLENAARGRMIPEGREPLRAEAALRLMAGRDQLPAESEIARAALLAQLGDGATARTIIAAYLGRNPETPWRELAEGVVDRFLRTAPTDASAEPE